MEMVWSNDTLITVKTAFQRFHSLLFRSHEQTQSQDVINPVGLIRPIILIFWSFGAIVFWSETGQMMSNNLEEMKDILWQSEWYSFPIEIQRMLPMAVANTQRPILVHGFGNLLFHRQSIKQVSAITMFTIVRNKKHQILHVISGDQYRIQLFHGLCEH